MRLTKKLVLSAIFVAMVPCSGYAHDPGNGNGSDDDHGYMGHKMDHSIVLAQLAAGEHYTTRIFLMNMGNSRRMPWSEEEDLETRGTLYMFHQDGSPFPVKVNDGATSAQHSFTLGAGKGLSLALTSEGVDTPGWALIEIDEDASSESSWGNMDDHQVRGGERIYVSAFYSLRGGMGKLQSQVGVMPAMFQREHFFTSIVAATFDDSSSTGVALVNTSSDSITVNLRLEDVDGKTVATDSLTLEAGNQKAVFIHEQFPDKVPVGYQGTLEVTSEGDGVIIQGLLMSEGVLTSIPVHHFGSWNNDDMGGGDMGGMGSHN